MLIRLILTVIFFTQFVTCLPSIVIKTGVKSDQTEQEHHNAGNHDVAFKLGTSGFNSEAGYNKDNENKHALAEDVGKYAEENADKKHHVDQSNFADEKFHQQGGGSVADFDNQAAHKKGNHKSGFHNTYHKDESGSNSSYYDDNDDQGGQYIHNSHKGTYGDTNSQNNRGSHLDGTHHSRENAKHGGYDKGGGYQSNSGDNRDYNREKYYNNRENQGQINGGNQYGGSKAYSQEKYHQRHPEYYEKPYYSEKPYYYEKPPYRADYVRDYYEPAAYDSYAYPEKKTITIYEDPRVYDQSVAYKSYEKYPQYDTNNYYNADLVQLDVRPPPRLNTPEYVPPKQAVYDNYYY